MTGPNFLGLSGQTLQTWWTNGLLIEAIVYLTLLEFAALLLYRRFTGKGLTARDYALNLMSGLGLMLAVRSAVLGQAWLLTAAWLSAAGVAHGADVLSRWRRQG